MKIYDKLSTYLGSKQRRHTSNVATWVERVTDDAIAVVYKSVRIVMAHKDGGVVLDRGLLFSPTAMKRMQYVLRGSRLIMRCSKNRWYIVDRVTGVEMDYYDGMVLKYRDYRIDGHLQKTSI